MTQNPSNERPNSKDPLAGAAVDEEGYDALSDAELVETCRNELPHGGGAFRSLLVRYEGMVFNTCLKMLGNVQDAEEACQDAFMRVYHKIDQFEGRSTFKTWLYRVVCNHCMTRRRQMAIRRERGTEIREVITAEMLEKQEDQTEAADAASEKVHQALAQLRAEDREMIVLRFVSDLSLEEMAEVLDLKLSATKMRLYRAIDRFKDAFLELSNAEETENEKAGTP